MSESARCLQYSSLGFAPVSLSPFAVRKKKDGEPGSTRTGRKGTRIDGGKMAELKDGTDNPNQPLFPADIELPRLECQTEAEKKAMRITNTKVVAR